MKAIMYHYVRKWNEEYPFFNFLHVDDFKKQLDYFAYNYKMLAPDAIKESIESGRMAEGVALTFDDGLKDHIQFVFPELKKRGRLNR